MLTLRNLTPVLDNFMIGDANTHKILKPRSIDFNAAVDAEVESITASESAVIIWVKLHSSN